MSFGKELWASRNDPDFIQTDWRSHGLFVGLENLGTSGGWPLNKEFPMQGSRRWSLIVPTGLLEWEDD